MRDRFPWILSAAYAALFCALGVLRYAVHRNFVDFGIFAQTTASAFGCFCNTIEGSHWAFHFSPILYVIGAIVALWHSPFVLIGAQAVACALAIPPIYDLVRAKTDKQRGRFAAIIVALYPALAGLTFNDFHENGFAPAAIAWTLWAFITGRTALTYVFAAIALSIKEDQALFLAVAGALGAWRWRGTRQGQSALIVAIASIAVFASFVFLIQPHAAANPAWSGARFYAWTSDDVRQLPGGLLVRAGFIVLAFLPLMFLPFRSAFILLAAAPFAEVLMSRMSTTYTMGSHYAGAWLGYVLVAFALVVRDARAEGLNRLLYGCIALCSLELLLANPMHPGMNLRPIQARDRTLDAFLATLPPHIDLATQEEAFTHLALTHPFARLLPERNDQISNACYALVDLDYPQSVILLEYGDALQALVHSGLYRAQARSGAVTLYRSRRCRTP